MVVLSSESKSLRAPPPAAFVLGAGHACGSAVFGSRVEERASQKKTNKWHIHIKERGRSNLESDGPFSSRSHTRNSSTNREPREETRLSSVSGSRSAPRDSSSSAGGAGFFSFSPKSPNLYPSKRRRRSHPKYKSPREQSSSSTSATPPSSVVCSAPPTKSSIRSGGSRSGRLSLGP